MTGIELIEATKTLQKIADFVAGDGLVTAVSAIVGNVHAEAARMALNSSKRANNSRDRVNSAVTHLEAAHVAFKQTHDQHRDLFFTSKLHEIILAGKSDAWVCCLLALCYIELGENTLARGAIGDATFALNLAERLDDAELPEGASEWRYLAAVPAAFLTWFRPDSWKAALADAPKITASDLQEVSSNLDRVLLS